MSTSVINEESALAGEKALAIVRRLREAGFTAYLAGGCVRDRLLGVTAKDYDIATDARPAAVQSLFDRTLAAGAHFGVIIVILGDGGDRGDDAQFEVATFRADGAYLDGRRPSSVRFGTLAEDAARRDFTIGGMYFDPATDRVIDLVGGRRDLRRGLVRAIGKAGERFAEDHLRMLRAVRFAARLGFAIESDTWAAIRASASAITAIAAERIGQELVMLMTEGGAADGLDLLVASGLAAGIMPEVLELPACDQPANFHPEGNVYRHTRLMLSMLPRGCSETLAFGTLLHDIAKPRCRAVAADGKVTFYGHTEQGSEIATDLMQRLRRSRFVQERVAYLVRYHLQLCMAPRMRPATLKRMITQEGFDELLELSLLDALASSSYLGFYHFCRGAIAELGATRARPPRLVGGADLIALGLTPGPAFKTILTEIEDLHLDGVLRSRAEALRYLRDHHGPAPAAADD